MPSLVRASELDSLRKHFSITKYIYRTWFARSHDYSCQVGAPLSVVHVILWHTRHLCGRLRQTSQINVFGSSPVLLFLWKYFYDIFMNAIQNSRIHCYLFLSLMSVVRQCIPRWAWRLWLFKNNRIIKHISGTHQQCKNYIIYSIYSVVMSNETIVAPHSSMIPTLSTGYPPIEKPVDIKRSNAPIHWSRRTYTTYMYAWVGKWLLEGSRKQLDKWSQLFSQCIIYIFHILPFFISHHILSTISYKSCRSHNKDP